MPYCRGATKRVLAILSLFYFPSKVFDQLFCALCGCCQRCFVKYSSLLFLFWYFQPVALTASLWGIFMFMCLHIAHCTHSHRAGNCGNAIAMTIKSGKTAVRHTSNKINMEHIAILFTHVIQIMNEFTRINVPHQKPCQTDQRRGIMHTVLNECASFLINYQHTHIIIISAMHRMRRGEREGI